MERNPLNSQVHTADRLMFIFMPGTSPDGVDVQDFVDVGVTNMVAATGLTLLDGLTYYVTLRGMYIYKMNLICIAFANK